MVAVFLCQELKLTEQEVVQKFANLDLIKFGLPIDKKLEDYPEDGIDWVVYLSALNKAKSFSWFNSSTFDIKSYHHFSNFMNGDISWIVPNIVLAFSSPCDDPKSTLYFTQNPSSPTQCLQF
jgi:hypothetical protein